MARFQLIDAELSCEGNGAKASGSLEGHYIVVVRAGSTAKGYWPMDERMLQQGIVVHDGELLKFAVDFPFPNPTTAAHYILGDNTDGWRVWRNASGQTLRELMRHAAWEWLIH